MLSAYSSVVLSACLGDSLANLPAVFMDPFYLP